MANFGYLQITRQCNQKCRFCSNPPTDYAVTLDQGLAHIDDFIRRGYLGVMITGGEPTVSPDLAAYLSTCRDKGFICKLITNGRKIAARAYLDRLIEAGLQHVCISVHTYRPDLASALSREDQTLELALAALENLGRAGITTDVLTTIVQPNADHLDETARFLIERFPFIYHYTWNGLDPRTDRVAENRDLVPRLRDFEISLFNAMTDLDSKKLPFQVERVPLCYMAEFADRSTETRRIVKDEERGIYFLDERGFLLWKNWVKQKGKACQACTLDPICAGLHEGGTYYSLDELYPLFLDPAPIRLRILTDGANGAVESLAARRKP